MSSYIYAQDAQAYISRYEMTQIMQQGICQDCFTPPLAIKQTYTPSRLKQFQTILIHNVDDLTLPELLFQGKNYAYCVASAADNGWINGYPKKDTIPCAGKFCGENNARGTELITMMSNMIGPYIWQNYPIDFPFLQQRAKNNTLDIESLGTLNKALDRCGSTGCIAQSPEEFSIYMQYCTSNLSTCDMQSYPYIQQGQRPIAEINILQQAKILLQDDPLLERLGSQVQMSDVQRLLPRIRELTNCIVVEDYDADGIRNGIDTCPDIYNPHQHDLDADRTGDVCDTDIDGDGALNAPNAVDDEGIIISPSTNEQDFCPFVENNLLGQQTCEDFLSREIHALDIAALPLKAIVGTSITFPYTTDGDSSALERAFGDGTTYKGNNPTHIYAQAGVYTVTAQQKNLFGTSIVAQTQVYIDTPTNQEILDLRCNPLTGSVNDEIRCLMRTEAIDPATLTALRRSRGDQTETFITTDISSAFVQSKIFLQAGIYTIQVELFFGIERVLVQNLTVYIQGESATTVEKNKNPAIEELQFDKDKDRISDELDTCPEIPESYNGVDDKDGCPELPASCKPGSKCSGKAPACTTCPCAGADFSSALRKGDSVRAVLLDEAGTLIYRYSPPVTIDVSIPDKMLGK